MSDSTSANPTPLDPEEMIAMLRRDRDRVVMLIDGAELPQALQAEFKKLLATADHLIAGIEALKLIFGVKQSGTGRDAQHADPQ